MIEFNSMNARIWSKLGQRGTFGVIMLQLAPHIESLFVLTADLSTTSGLDRFRNTYPDKFLNTGIAEQNMVGIASGLAKEGYVVFCSTFATFAAMRSLEQVRVHMGYMGLKVKLVGLASGFAMGMFGNTHYGIEDIAIMRSVPNLVVLSPADCGEVAKAVEAAALYRGPVFIRLSGVMNNPIVYKEDYTFQIGRAVTLQEGSDVALIATGSVVSAAQKAAILLRDRSISASVINMHTLKPIDTLAIEEACKKKLVVTIEEHNVLGGLGGAVSEHLSRIPNAPRQILLGIPDAFPKAGEYSYLIEHSGLTAPQIAELVHKKWGDF